MPKKEKTLEEKILNRMSETEERGEKGLKERNLFYIMSLLNGVREYDEEFKSCLDGLVKTGKLKRKEYKNSGDDTEYRKFIYSLAQGK